MFDDWHVLELYFDTSKNHATLIGKYWIGIFYLNIILYINRRAFKLRLLISRTTFFIKQYVRISRNGRKLGHENFVRDQSPRII